MIAIRPANCSLRTKLFFERMGAAILSLERMGAVTIHLTALDRLQKSRVEKTSEQANATFDCRY
jgi:hypothetical protein